MTFESALTGARCPARVEQLVLAGQRGHDRAFGTPPDQIVRERHGIEPVALRQQPGLARDKLVELCAQDAVDVAQVVNNAATLVAAGYAVDAAWLSEVTGMKFNKGERA